MYGHRVRCARTPASASTTTGCDGATHARSHTSHTAEPAAASPCPAVASSPSTTCAQAPHDALLHDSLTRDCARGISPPLAGARGISPPLASLSLPGACAICQTLMHATVSVQITRRAAHNCIKQAHARSGPRRSNARLRGTQNKKRRGRREPGGTQRDGQAECAHLAELGRRGPVRHEIFGGANADGALAVAPIHHRIVLLHCERGHSARMV